MLLHEVKWAAHNIIINSNHKVNQIVTCHKKAQRERINYSFV